LDPCFEPRISDFGFAREGPLQEFTHISVSHVIGTKPYLPDEFLRGKKLSTKVDTYSFGVVSVLNDYTNYVGLIVELHSQYLLVHL